MNSKELLKESIRKIIFETIEESGGFRKFKKSSTGSTPGNRKGNLQIAYCKSAKAKSSVTGKETEYIAVCLSHVWKDGLNTLVDAINKSVPAKVMNAIVNNNTVIIRVNLAMKNEIPNYVMKMGESIKQLNDYSEQSIDNLCVSIFDEVDEVATTADLDNAKEKSISNWMEMLSLLEDPQVRQRLLRYQTTNDYARTYGHILSPNNVKDVLDQFPTASFVAEASTWKRIFNRTIKPGAQRIVVSKPIVNNLTKKDYDEAAIKCGFESYKDAKEKTKGATQVMNKIKITAQENAKEFIKVVMYDVSETTPPADPRKDVWTNQIGLQDNLTGILNSEAQTFDERHSSKIQQDNKEKINQTQKSKWKNRRLAIKLVCDKHNIPTESFNSLTDEEFIIKASMLYAEKLAPSYGVVHPQQIEEVKALVVATIAMCCDSPIPSFVSKYINKRAIDRTLGVAAYNIAGDMIPKINKACRTKEVQTLNDNN